MLFKIICRSYCCLDIKSKVIESLNKRKCFFLILIGKRNHYRSVIG